MEVVCLWGGGSGGKRQDSGMGREVRSGMAVLMNALWNHHFSHHVNIFLWEKLKLNSKRNQKRKSPPWVDQPLLVPLQISLTTCYLISHQGRRKLWNLQCNLPKTKSVPGLDLTKYIPASCLACNLFSQFRQVHSYRIPSECLFSITPVHLDTLPERR